MRKPDPRFSRKSIVSFASAALIAVTAAAAQVAAPADNALDTSGNYRSEVQACMQGKTGEDQATCLKEARNAQADKKRGVLDNASGQFQANARARCDVLNGEDKAACQARMMGYGSVTGSVAGGGLLREVETVVMPIPIEPMPISPVVVPSTIPAPNPTTNQ